MIKKSIRFAIIVLLLHLSPKAALSQPDTVNGYHIEHFTDENGLPQNSINDLVFDDRGCLWLASQVGLIRFDGRSFKLYAPKDRPAMESNFMSIGRSTQGALFCRTDDQSLYGQPDASDLSVSLINTVGLERPLLLNNSKQLVDFSFFLRDAHPGSIDQFAERRLIFNYLGRHDGSFYATDSAHIYLIYNNVSYYYANSSLARLEKGTQPTPGSAAGSARGRMYMLLGDRFYILKGDSVEGVYRDGKPVAASNPATLGGQAMALRGDLRKDLAARRLSPENAMGLRLFPGTVPHLLAGNRLYEVVPDADGGLSTRWLLDLDFVNNVSSVICNSSLGLLLVTSQTEGFYALHKSRFKGPVFAPALQVEMDRYLFGPMALRGKEVLTDRFAFDGSGAFTLLPDQHPPWQRCLYLDKRGHVWGAFGNLPREMNGDMGLLRVLPVLDAEIVDYKEDGDGSLYCLTEHSLWRLGTDSFNLIYRNDGQGAVHESFCLVAPGRAWIATTNGLLDLDIQKRQTRVIPDLTGKHVRSIHPCKDGSILLGTYGQGYFYYRGEGRGGRREGRGGRGEGRGSLGEGHFFQMPMDKNGWLVTAHCFLEDDRGIVWIPCNKGLFKVPKRDMDAWCDSTGGLLYYYYYGRQDGLSTNEFNGGFNSSGIITTGGLVALLSMKGMVCFYADSLRSDFPEGPVEITHVEAGGTSSLMADRIALTAGYDGLMVEVSCPYLGNQNNLYLEYNVQGLNKEWTELGKDGVINLSRLSPGIYTLQVRKVNGFGKNNFSYSQWTIHVTPHFYQTVWFWTIIAVAILLLVILLVHSRLKRKQMQKELQAKAEKLSATVAARDETNAKLNETVNELRDSQRALLHTSKMKEKLISLVIHDLRSPIRFLSMMAGDLHDNFDQLSQGDMKERTYWIKKGTKDMYTFSEDFLLWVTSQKNNFSITRSLVPLLPLLQEMAEFFREQLIQKGNALTIEALPELTIYSDPHILITILRNVVDNANKYTSNGKITIRAAGEGHSVSISVVDTGKGMSSRQVESFLSRDNLDGIRSGTQLGHTFIVDLTQRMNGSVSIESEEGQGTTILLRFSSPSASYTSPA